MTILFVDDDAQILKFMQTALSKHGYTVIVSKSAEEALEMLTKIKVNLIISDVNMPGMKGTEFCQVVREKKELWGYIPVILLTAFSSVDDAATGLVAGADDYLSKPIHIKKLLTIIEEYAM